MCLVKCNFAQRSQTPYMWKCIPFRGECDLIDLQSLLCKNKIKPSSTSVQQPIQTRIHANSHSKYYRMCSTEHATNPPLNFISIPFVYLEAIYVLPALCRALWVAANDILCGGSHQHINPMRSCLYNINWATTRRRWQQCKADIHTSPPPPHARCCLAYLCDALDCRTSLYFSTHSSRFVVFIERCNN